MKTRLINAAMQIWSCANDFYLGIRTVPRNDLLSSFSAANTRSKHRDGVAYQGAAYRNTRRIVRVLDPGGNDCFYDIGSGMGRVVCIFARRPLCRVIGIDFDPSLCAAARENAARLRKKQAPIDIRCEDAANADLREGTLYFLHNPFGIGTLRDFLDNLENSSVREPRNVRMVYYTSLHEGELVGRPFWVKYFETETLTRRPISFWRNDASGR